MRGSYWNPEEVKELYRLRGEGYSYREIGDKIGRSRFAVRNKLVREGLTGCTTIVNAATD